MVCCGHLTGSAASLCLVEGLRLLRGLRTSWSIHCLTTHPGAQARVLPASHPSRPAVSHHPPHPFPPHCPPGRDVSGSLLIGPPAAVPAHLLSITQLECSLHSERQIMLVPCLKQFNKLSFEDRILFSFIRYSAMCCLPLPQDPGFHSLSCGLQLAHSWQLLEQ